MFVDPTNSGLRLVYFYLEPLKSSSVGRCILSLHFVWFVYQKKKSKKGEKKKKEFLVEIVQFVGVLGLQPLLVFT
jgi:hypothetical protein